MAFRITSAVLIGLLVFMGADMHGGNGFGTAPAWVAALLAGGAVFAFTDLLLPMLTVAIPPGLLVLSIIGLAAR